MWRLGWYSSAKLLNIFSLFAKDSGFNIDNNIVEILIPQLQLHYFHYKHMQFVKPCTDSSVG